MSRGGTRKARAAHASLNRDRERRDAAETRRRAKADKAARPKAGKGRAFLLHLSGIPGPLVAGVGLLLSGVVETGGVTAQAYWLVGLAGDANAPYWSEPAGLAHLMVTWVLAIGAFWASPVGTWRLVYRDRPVVDRDRSAVDSAATMMALVATAWLVRALIGYVTAIGSIASVLVILALYVPTFSALLVFVLPVIPGSGRIGGILPDMVRLPFTARVLLTDEERVLLGGSQDSEHKQQG